MLKYLLLAASLCFPSSKKAIIITGGTSGIGKALAKKLQKRVTQKREKNNTVVVITGRRDSGKQIAKEIGCEFFQMDVANENEWKKLAERYPKWCALVNNAGIINFQDNDIEKLSVQTFYTIYKTNVLGVMLGCKYAIKAMKEGGGVILNISSIGALGGYGFLDGIYPSSKAAISCFTKHVVAYCAKKGYKIRCVNLLPGFTESAMFDELMKSRIFRWIGVNMLKRQIPMKRFAQCEEIAEVACFLLSDKASYISSDIIADGGMSSMLFTL